MQKSENKALLLDYLISMQEYSAPFAPDPVTEETLEILKKITAITDRFAPTAPGSSRRRFFIHTARPCFEEYAAFQRTWEDDTITEDELKRDYAGEYPDPEKWYEVFVVHMPKDVRYDEFIAVDLNETYVLAMNDPNARGGASSDLRAETRALLSCITEAQARIAAGTYSRDVAENLPVRYRTGVISRKEYWDLFPDERRKFRAGLTEDEVSEFVLCAENAGEEDVLPEECCLEMTARKYFEAVAAGARAAGWNIDRRSPFFTETGEEHMRYGGRTPREIYCACADGRDNGLTGVPLDDADAFSLWYRQKGPYFVFNGNHPWELEWLLHLIPEEEDGRWYFLLTGGSFSNSKDAVKMYLGMKHAGIPVIFSGIREMAKRYEETDWIGILPWYQYAGGWHVPDVFGDLDVGDCEYLPDDEGMAKEVALKVHWFPEQEIILTLSTR